MERRYSKHEKPERDQLKSLDFKENVETDGQYYGEDDEISTQIVTNYYYSPGNR